MQKLRLSLIVGYLAIGAVYGQFPGLSLDDRIYNEDIKTVLLYPSTGETDNPTRLLKPPVVVLNSGQSLTLEFDNLSDNSDNYRARFVHCNADWSKSVLNEVEFTVQYNDYVIRDVTQSMATKVPYYHYTINLPGVKVSGNYVVFVYSEHDNKPVLSRRFMVYDPKVSLTATVGFSQGIGQQRTDQQVDFSISFKGFQLVSPQNDLKVVIRQNFRWDRIKTNFRPSNINAFEQVLSYQFFNLENSFKGGNEFRYFDSRTITARGFGVAGVDRKEDFTRLILFTDKTRNVDAYLEMDDFNGGYVIDHKETGKGGISADYTPVDFILKTEELNEGEDVYVNGAFNLWERNDRNRMVYDTQSGTYRAEILLKQGVINYDYAVLNKKGDLNETLFEGDYSQTENDYDVLVYYRPPAGRADQLIGYRTLEWNRRR